MARTLRWPTSLKKQIAGEPAAAGKVGRITTLVVWLVFGGISIDLIRHGLTSLTLICWVVMLISLAGLIPGAAATWSAAGRWCTRWRRLQSG